MAGPVARVPERLELLPDTLRAGRAEQANFEAGGVVELAVLERVGELPLGIDRIDRVA